MPHNGLLQGPPLLGPYALQFDHWGKPQATTPPHTVMPAYLTSCDTISALVTYWFASAEGSRHSTPRDNLRNAFYLTHGNHYHADQQAAELIYGMNGAGSAEEAVFQLLVSENVLSLKARYPHAPEMWEEAENYVFKRSQSVFRWMNYAPFGHGNLVDMARGYSYQSCEHEGWEKSVAFQIIQQIRAFLLDDLAKRDTDGKSHWASFEEPALVKTA